MPYQIKFEDPAPLANAVQETPDGTKLTVDLKILDESTRQALRKAVLAVVGNASPSKGQ